MTDRKLIGKQLQFHANAGPPSDKESTSRVGQPASTQASDTQKDRLDVGISASSREIAKPSRYSAEFAALAPHKKPRFSMEEKMDTFRDKENKVRALAAEEYRRGRPLIMVSRTNGSLLSHHHPHDELVSGFEYTVWAHTKKSQDQQYVDWSLVYLMKDFRLQVFYGSENKTTISMLASDLQQHDTDGSLIESILGINAPGPIQSTQAEGIGLLAACIGAGYMGPPSPEEAEKLLQMLSVPDRSECLRNALIFACYQEEGRWVDELFRLGADPNTTSSDDDTTPLEIATSAQNLDLIRTLLQQGADPDLELASGSTCRSLAKTFENPLLLQLFDSHPTQQE